MSPIFHYATWRCLSDSAITGVKQKKAPSLQYSQAQNKVTLLVNSKKRDHSQVRFFSIYIFLLWCYVILIICGQLHHKSRENLSDIFFKKKMKNVWGGFFFFQGTKVYPIAIACKMLLKIIFIFSKLFRNLSIVHCNTKLFLYKN